MGRSFWSCYRPDDRATGSDVVSERIDRVVRQAQATVWHPPDEDGFDA